MTLGYYAGAAQGGAEWVLADTACRRCGQNLRGLHVTQACPGCGTLAGFSTPERLLRFADAGWLARVRSGLLITFWTTLGVIALLGLVFGAAVIVGAQQAAQVAPPPPGGAGSVAVATGPADFTESKGFELAGNLVTLAASIVLVVGTFRLTAAEPPTADPRPGGGAAAARPTAARRLARVAALLALGHTFASAVLEWFGHTTETSKPLEFVGLAFAFVQVAGWAAAVHVMAELAARVPDAALAFRCRLSMWGVGTGVGVILLLAVVMAVSGTEFDESDPSAALGGGIIAAGCTMGLAGLSAFVFFVFYLVALMQLANRAGDARTYADQVATLTAAAPLHPLPAGSIPTAAQPLPNPHNLP